MVWFVIWGWSGDNHVVKLDFVSVRTWIYNYSIERLHTDLLPLQLKSQSHGCFSYPGTSNVPLCWSEITWVSASIWLSDEVTDFLMLSKLDRLWWSSAEIMELKYEQRQCEVKLYQSLTIIQPWVTTVANWPKVGRNVQIVQKVVDLLNWKKNTLLN